MLAPLSSDLDSAWLNAGSGLNSLAWNQESQRRVPPHIQPTPHWTWQRGHNDRNRTPKASGLRWAHDRLHPSQEQSRQTSPTDEHSQTQRHHTRDSNQSRWNKDHLHASMRRATDRTPSPSGVRSEPMATSTTPQRQSGHSS